MKDNKSDGTYSLVATAFPGDHAPPQLSVAIVSLVELCKLAMPDPKKVHEAIISAKFAAAPQARANEAGAILALDKQVVASPVRDLKHQMFERDRHGEMVIYLLSEGRTNRGKIVFLSTLFRGAMEADAVKAVAHVSKQKPITGARAVNGRGEDLRRVFWSIEQAGIKGLVVTGPQNVEALNDLRAFTAFAEVR